MAVGTGCEVDSWGDFSSLGRWERTPVVLPILDRLNVIEDLESPIEGLSDIRPEDLIPVVHEYIIGPGDVLTTNIFELIQPNVESILVREVDELGMIRLPIIGPVRVEGITPSGLEKKIADILDEKGVLKDATVSISVQLAIHSTYSVISDVSGSGAFNIPKKEFRLLDAMAMAGGPPSSTPKIFVIRQIPLGTMKREVISSGEEAQPELPQEAPGDPVGLIEDLLSSVDQDIDADLSTTGPVQAEIPAALDKSTDTFMNDSSQWVHVNGKWVRLGQASSQKGASMPVGPADMVVTQRIIEVPYSKLLDGEMRYNLVIRPGDVIRVPSPVNGNVYVGGQIARPGTYALPPTDYLTLKQLIFAAGSLAPTGIPERVDLTRRIGANQEATVRLNLRSIFDGTQPDFYLKPNDTINIGTNLFATPWAVVRNGFRFSYGFGFVLDRNFNGDLFGFDINRGQ